MSAWCIAAVSVLVCAAPAHADFGFKRVAGGGVPPAEGDGTFRRIYDVKLGRGWSDGATTNAVFSGWLSDGTRGLYDDSNGATSGRVVFDSRTEAPPAGSGQALYRPSHFAIDEIIGGKYGYVIDSGPGPSGVFRGTTQRIADLTTIAPGYGTAFKSFTETDLHGNLQVFAAGTSTRTLIQNGLYLYDDAPNTLSQLAGDTIAVPGAPGEKFTHYYHPQFTHVGGSTRVYFGGFSDAGRYGLYSVNAAGGDLRKIVDDRDIVPDTGDPVGGFLGYSVHDGKVALGSGGGILTVEGGVLAMAVGEDTNDPEDDSDLYDIGAGGVSRWGDNIAFTAYRAEDNTAGLYLLAGETLHRVTAAGDDFNGDEWVSFSISNRSVHGDTVAFTMDSEEGDAGVYTATLGGSSQVVNLDDTYAYAEADTWDLVPGPAIPPVKIRDDSPPFYGVTAEAETTQGGRILGSGYGRATINPFGGGGSVAVKAYSEGSVIREQRPSSGKAIFVSQLEPVGGDDVVDFDIGWLLTGTLSIRGQESRAILSFEARAKSETNPEVILASGDIIVEYHVATQTYRFSVGNNVSPTPLVDIRSAVFDPAFVVTPHPDGMDVNVELEIAIEDLFFLMPGEHVSLHYALVAAGSSDDAGWFDIDFGDTWELHPDSDTPGVEFVVVVPEPATALIVALGCAGLLRRRRRARQ